MNLSMRFRRIPFLAKEVAIARSVTDGAKQKAHRVLALLSHVVS